MSFSLTADLHWQWYETVELVPPFSVAWYLFLSG